MDTYAIYLRKSRVDLDAERSGQGETLKRHETALLTLARQRQYPIGEIYREIVSGDTIAGRPEMRRLLADVEAGRWKGVLVMEESRLARGDTMDQGRVQQAFYYSHTQIITPNKLFDPDSEADQEYFEFGLFMSRREYKMINRRLYRGRLASVKEGKWIGGQVPYGYRKISLEQEKGKILVPVPEQAKVVQAVFQWYVTDGVSVSAIARRLNTMGLKTAKGQLFSTQAVRTILDNPVYCGMIRCGSRKVEKRPVNGELVEYHCRVPDVEGVNLFQGRQEPLVSRALFETAKRKRSAQKGIPGPRQPLRNPFAGLIYCSNCGRVMQRNKGKRQCSDRLWCPYPSCRNVVGLTTIPDIENLIVLSLEHRLGQLELPAEIHPAGRHGEERLLHAGLENAKKEAAGIAAQKAKSFELVEQGVYTTSVFSARVKELEGRETVCLRQIEELEVQLGELARASIERQAETTTIRRVIELYPRLSSPEEKNRLLKTVISSITYFRPIHGNVEDLRLKIYYLL